MMSSLTRIPSWIAINWKSSAVVAGVVGVVAACGACGVCAGACAGRCEFGPNKKAADMTRPRVMCVDVVEGCCLAG